MKADTHTQTCAESATHAHTPQGAALRHPTPQQSWLNIQCRMLQDIACGMLFKVSPDFKQAHLDASWPRSVTARDDMLRKVLGCAEQETPILEEIPAEGQMPTMLRLYQPVAIDGGNGNIGLVLVIEMSDRSSTERRTVANLLRWNTEWLKFALVNEPVAGHGDLSSMFSIAIAALDQDEFRGTATALVTELTGRFACQRVSLGLRKGNRIKVEVLSHSARFKQETNLIQAIGAAMDESADQDRSIVYPQDSKTSTAITQAHAKLAQQLHGGSIATIPISDRGHIIGALTLERDAEPAFDDSEIYQVEQVLALVAPALWLKHQEEKGLPIKAWRSARRTLGKLLGPAHIKLKLAALLIAGLAMFFSLANGDWRVTADAVVEGSVQRSIAAPIDGYIASADARAGDLVTEGQQLGTLDDSDLRLQRLKWSTLRQQMISELREARAQNSRAEVSIIGAKIEQANAELELVDAQLGRTRLLAPFAGVVIEGDLSQMLGTPIRRGDPLFKIAPLDDYRIALQVGEQDITSVHAGHRGRLILASMPEQTLELEVVKITPVSTAESGRNYFRVEARLLGEPPRLQPGMEGIGKVTVGEARLIWIWTHELIDWLRLQTWTWWR